MSRLTNDIDNINTTLSQSLTQLISGIINVVGMLIAMLMLNPVFNINRTCKYSTLLYL